MDVNPIIVLIPSIRFSLFWRMDSLRG